MGIEYTGTLMPAKSSVIWTMGPTQMAANSLLGNTAMSAWPMTAYHAFASTALKYAAKNLPARRS